MTELWLVRHGVTDWNQEGRFQGQSDVPLNKQGISQAEMLAARLMEEKTFDAVFASDLQRALRTAEILAAGAQLQVQVDRRLREVNQGEWEGELFQDIVGRYCHVWEQRRADPENTRPPGGETVTEVARRMQAAADDIACRYPGGRVLLVSHGLALATLVCLARGYPLSDAYSHILDNAVPEMISWPEDGCGGDKAESG